MNTIILTVGDVRTGKSAFAIRLGERLAKEGILSFDESHIHFKAQPFIDDMMKSSKTFMVLDEVGIEYDSQTWFTIQNMAFKYIIESQGFRLNVICMTVPSPKFISPSIRGLVNLLVTTKRQGYVKVYKNKVMAMTGKIFNPRMVLIKFKMPSQDLWTKYLDKKSQFSQDLLTKLNTLVKYSDTKMVGGGMTAYQLSKIQKNQASIEYMKVVMERMKNKEAMKKSE